MSCNSISGWLVVSWLDRCCFCGSGVSLLLSTYGWNLYYGATIMYPYYHLSMASTSIYIFCWVGLSYWSDFCHGPLVDWYMGLIIAVWFPVWVENLFIVTGTMDQLMAFHLVFNESF
jgi:hypothetical protein